MTDEAFKEAVTGLRIKLSEKDYNLGKENNRMWSEIAAHKYQFERQEKDVSTLDNLTKQEFQEFMQKYLFSADVKRLDYLLTAEVHKDKNAAIEVENNEYFKAKGIKREVRNETF